MSKSQTELIFNNRRKISEYTSYANKRPYYAAIATGDINLIYVLTESNYEYPRTVFEHSSSYSDAFSRYHRESICAAAEFCLIAIQNGLPDMVAYDIRDSFIGEFEHAVSLPDLYDLIHGMAHEFALRVRLTHNNKIGSPRLLKMMSYIEDNLYEPISLQDVADAGCVSRTYASRVFKEECGITISKFIMRERINEAKRLLSDGELDIGEIASRLQFCSQSHFGECFKKLEGMTANEYRNHSSGY